MQKSPTLGWTFEVFTFTADCKLDFTDRKLDLDEALKICKLCLKHIHKMLIDSHAQRKK
ncbi:hypothetical protein LguiA_033675 [Lonicera macranthoides]